jgi:hypothetical protein
VGRQAMRQSENHAARRKGAKEAVGDSGRGGSRNGQAVYDMRFLMRRMVVLVQYGEIVISCVKRLLDVGYITFECGSATKIRGMWYIGRPHSR